MDTELQIPEDRAALEAKLAEMIREYLTSQYKFRVEDCAAADAVLVFARKDDTYVPLLAELWHSGKVKHIVISGGLGKDSGPLKVTGTPEADFLAVLLLQAGVPAEAMKMIDRKATNGIQNSQNGLTLLAEHAIFPERMILFGCPDNLLRLAAFHQAIAERECTHVPDFASIKYEFLAVPWLATVDQKTLFDTMRRLRDCPHETPPAAAQFDLPAVILELMAKLRI